MVRERLDRPSRLLDKELARSLAREATRILARGQDNHREVGEFSLIMNSQVS